MRLLFVNGNPLEACQGNYYVHLTWPKFAKQISEYVEHANLLAPVQHIDEYDMIKGEPFIGDSLKIIELPYFNGLISYYYAYVKHPFRIHKTVREQVALHDIVFVRVPHPISALVTKHCIKAKKPYVLFVAGSLNASSKLIMSKGIKRHVYQFLVDYFDNREERHGRNAALVYTCGEKLAGQYLLSCKNVKAIRTALVSQRDINNREDTCAGDSIELIIVCIIIPVKGIEYLLEAVASLRKEDFPIRLTIVGEALDKNYHSLLKELIDELEIENSVDFIGWIHHKDIYDMYDKADIQVVASLHEGLPRVILEGGARCLPLVSTSVGGISSSIANGEEGILVPPRDSAALADGIRKVITEGDLRRKIIRGRAEMVRRNSSEIICREIVEDLQDITSNA